MPTKRPRSPTPPLVSSASDEAGPVDAQPSSSVSGRHQRRLPPPTESRPVSPDSPEKPILPQRSVAGPSRRVADAGPSRSVADAGPSQSVADAGPSRSVTDMGPSRSGADAAPSQSVADAGPSRRLADVGPSRRVSAVQGPQPSVSIESAYPRLTELLVASTGSPVLLFSLDDFKSKKDKMAVINLRSLMRIDTQVSTMNLRKLRACYEVIKRSIEGLSGVSSEIEEFEAGGVIIVTVEGQNPKLSSIVLNAHLDTPDCDFDSWVARPLGANIYCTGGMYALGIQNSKTNAIQYIEAIRKLRSKRITLERNVYITLGTEGARGIGEFLTMQKFQTWNVGFVLDAGIPSRNSYYIISNCEKSTWHVDVTCRTTKDPTPVTDILPNAPGEKLRTFMEKVKAFDDQEHKKLEQNSALSRDDIVVINYSKFRGGSNRDAIPAFVVTSLDIRFPLNYNHPEFQRQLELWATESQCTLEYTLKQGNLPKTVVYKDDPFLKAIKMTCYSVQLKSIRTSMDTQYFRSLGKPTFGFSPMNNTEPRRHSSDEYLNLYMYLRGITIYAFILQNLDIVNF